MTEIVSVVVSFDERGCSEAVGRVVDIVFNDEQDASWPSGKTRRSQAHCDMNAT